MIDVQHLTKEFQIPTKEPGIRNTVRHFFRRTYRRVRAVEDVSFHIASGEIVGFLGPNGAGKTTTLKMLAGLIFPSSGSVRVGNFVPYERQHAYLRTITLVMGNKEQLLWDLPALDALRLNAAVYDISATDFTSRLASLTEILALDGKLNQPIRKLSLGERMKCELLAALLHHPRVLFLDEPTLGLDVNAQFAVREALREYNRRLGATILLTSHYMADISSLCSRVLLIHEGRLGYDGPLAGIVDRFAPWKEVRIKFSARVSPAALSQHGPWEETGPDTVTYLLPRETLTGSVAQILAQFPVVDLTVSEPPLERVIGDIFTRGLNSPTLTNPSGSGPP